MEQPPFSLTTIPTWVTACAYCRVDQVFRFLRQIVERDTQEMQALPQEIRGADFIFDCERPDQPLSSFRVRRMENEVAVALVAFAPTPQAIEITTRGRDENGQVVKKPPCHATLAWNAETHTCLLTIDRQTYTLGAAVEHLLKPLFFPSEQP